MCGLTAASAVKILGGGGGGKKGYLFQRRPKKNIVLAEIRTQTSLGFANFFNIFSENVQVITLPGLILLYIRAN